MKKVPHEKSVRCPSCKKKTPSRANFCTQCRYPIGIKKITAVTAAERSSQLANLFEVITKSDQPAFDDKKKNQLYDDMLSLHWLRPESALFGFLEIQLLRGLKKKYLRYPTLDLGCGDGLHTALLFGAKINKKYDAYEAIDFSKSDVYDTYTKTPRDLFETMPTRIGFGIDIKKSAVQKAERSGIYNAVTLGDVRKLPFRENSVRSVFSNMIDDVKREDLEQTFREVQRVLKSSGYFVFTTPTERFRESLWYYNKARRSKQKGDADTYRLFTTLDRGRSDWEPRPMSLWLNLFKKTSFKLIKRVGYVDEQALQFWDTGFRPFFHYLMEIRDRLRKNDLVLPVKKIWVEIMKQWLWHYAKQPLSKRGTFSVIVAKKS